MLPFKTIVNLEHPWVNFNEFFNQDPFINAVCSSCPDRIPIGNYRKGFMVMVPAIPGISRIKIITWKNNLAFRVYFIKPFT